MEIATKLLTLILATVTVIRIPKPSVATFCGGSCGTLDDCDGRLICINGMCADDPDVGTQTCRFTPSLVPSSTSQSCRPSGTMHCAGETYSRFDCSPPVTTSTSAKLTNNDFSEGGDGGAPSECDGRFHSNSDPVVALSSGWYSGGSRCGRKIKITSTKTGRTVLATVVDECDSMNGCDDEHANQPPCPHNIVDGSDAVWTALGLDKEVGVEAITWSMT